AKVTLHLHPMPPGKESGPSVSSPYSYIRFSFKQGGHSELRSRGVGGIVGIERKLEQQSKQTDDNINKAFKDLDALMEKAKEMVEIADKVASKLEEKKGSITEDETVMFKSYLLSMGIDNPVTRDTVGTGANYHNELAKELGKFLDAIIKDEGGMMALSDVYCRFNRARGMELVSPEDLVNASQQFEKLRIPLRLRRFESGVLVVQSISHSDEEVVISTKKAVSAVVCSVMVTFL
ncbi:predicted protein, partial [Nematostella vectensis]